MESKGKFIKNRQNSQFNPNEVLGDSQVALKGLQSVGCDCAVLFYFIVINAEPWGDM